MQRCAEVEGLARELYSALRCADVEGLTRLMSTCEDAVFVGTDPAECWIGLAAIEAGLRASFDGTSGFDLVEEHPRAYREGSVAWLVDVLAFLLPDGADVPVRVSAVARSERSAWRFVHVHMSVGVRSALPPEVVVATSRPRQSAVDG